MIPLHCHSYYSLFDGFSSPKQIIDKCKQEGWSACAVTDHGNVNCAVSFFNEARKAGIKPIFGCEMYICKNHSHLKNKENKRLSHLILLAKNKDGWKELLYLIYLSNKPESYYYKPRLSLDEIKENISGNNLIAITGHIGSTLADVLFLDKSYASVRRYAEARMLLNKENIKNKKIDNHYIKKYIEIFGKENVFLEAQLYNKHNQPAQQVLTEAMRFYSKLMGIKVIGTFDAHYANKEDIDCYRIKMCKMLNTDLKRVKNDIRQNKEFPMRQLFEHNVYYMFSEKEMREFGHTNQEIKNTHYVADQCEEFDIKNKPTVCSFNKNIQNIKEYFDCVCYRGFKNRGLDKLENSNIYKKRLEHELNIIHKSKLENYFLIVQDIIKYARNQKICIGVGRGSSAGCLVSYLLEITQIDPIKHDLLFERFYNEGRNSEDRIALPDIDIDVPKYSRKSIIDYIKSKYGGTKVAQIVSYQTLMGRAALKTVLRAKAEIGFEEQNNITKLLKDKAKIAAGLEDIEKEFGIRSVILWNLKENSEQLRDYCYIDDEGELQGPLSKEFQQAIKLENLKITQSKHAAGIVISKWDLRKCCPMTYDSELKELIVGVEHTEAEELGLMKLDILGLLVLDKISFTIDMMKKENQHE